MTNPEMSPGAQYVIPVFVFALGACIGSFLNVVVWRMPRGESLVTPPSRCPKCGNRLKPYHNIPVLGWIMLKGKCGFCGQSISARYPIIEAITGLIFLGYYLLFFVFQMGPCIGVALNADGMGHAIRTPMNVMVDWPIYALYMVLLSALLAASLIDAEHFMIPLRIPWIVVPVALLVHALNDHAGTPGGLIVGPRAAALALGAGMGTLISFILISTGVWTISFADGGPMLEIDREQLAKEREEQKKGSGKSGGKAVRDADPIEDDAETPPREWSSAEVRRELRKEMLFLMPPMLLGLALFLAVWRVPGIARIWDSWLQNDWLAAVLGSILGGLIGGFVVWIVRILGSLFFGREAMGLGDVHLMVAVGCVLGAGPVFVAFFLAPPFGLAIAIYLLLTGTRREMPLGPYLSLGSAATMIFYCDIAAYFLPGLEGGLQLLRNALFDG